MNVIILLVNGTGKQCNGVPVATAGLAGGEQQELLVAGGV